MDFENEAAFQAWCSGVMNKLDIHFVHISSAASRKLRRGILDIMAWKNGKSFIVELKHGTGALKPEQIQEIEIFKRQNIPVYVCRTADEFKKVLEEYI